MKSRSHLEEDAWRYILFRLQNDPGFWFGLVVGDDGRPRARLRERAKKWCEAHDRPFFVHAPAPEALRAVADELSRGREAGLHWIAADGLEGAGAQWDAGVKAMMMAMNERRDAYRRHLAAGVIVEGRLSLKPILRDFAPDMFSIRAFVSEVSADPIEQAPALIRPTAYFMVPGSPIGDTLEALLERVDRLTGIQDRDAVWTRNMAVLEAMFKLLDERRWAEASVLAERFAKEPVTGAGVTSDHQRSIQRLALVARPTVALEEGGAKESLARIEELKAEFRVLGPSRWTVADVACLFLLSLTELAAAEALGDWAGVARATHGVLGVLVDLAALVPFRIGVVQHRLIRACHLAGVELRSKGLYTEATAMLGALQDITSRALSLSPLDASWELFRASLSLLQVDDSLARRDGARALALSDEVLSLTGTHARPDEARWIGLLQGARLGRVCALAQLENWQGAAAESLALLQGIEHDAGLVEVDPWLSAQARIWRAHALRGSGERALFERALDEALDAATIAFRVGFESPLSESTCGLIPLLWWGTLDSVEVQDWAASDVARLTASTRRLWLSERLVGAAFHRFPSVRLAQVLSDVLTVKLAIMRLDRHGRHGVATRPRCRRRLRRMARSIRRWHEGEPPPLFVRSYTRWSKQAEGSKTTSR